jgi:hypothetical protein
METILDNLTIISTAVALVLTLLVIYLPSWSDSTIKKMKKKAAALANASVSVHSIRPVEPPDDLTEAEKAVDRRYYSVEVTIEPPPSPVPVRWKPRGLDTTDPDSDPQALEEPCELFAVEVWRGGRFVPTDGTIDRDEEVEGAQRVKLCVGAFPDARRFTIDYYLQNLGEIRLP